ncbi:MAG: crotonase/enoyl-CoA hydratase family protein [Chloroflexi bacterium]|nr:crotonase/enoyl-CoA hydratase family protein [Chloroflexota bacterium]
MAYQYLLYEKREGAVHLTLNRPEKLNALNAGLQDEIIQAAQEAEEDRDIRVVVIKGAGRAFSAGYDITPSPDREHGQRQITMQEDWFGLQKTVRRWRTLWDLTKPVIAQVHGYCVAGGTDLAFHCDMVVAAEDAQIGFPAVRSMGCPPTHMWTYLCGPQWAKRILLTGDLVDGKTAERIGLVLKAVPLAGLDAEVDRLARRLAMVPWDLLAANKSIVNRAIELMGRDVLQQISGQTDAVGHQAPIVGEFNRMAAEKGLKAALQWRDGKFAE